MYIIYDIQYFYNTIYLYNINNIYIQYIYINNKRYNK